MRNKTEAESDASLDRFEAEARAGAPDVWLRQHAEVSSVAVASWRRRRGITRYRRKNSEVASWALDLLRSGYNAELHTTSSTVLHGLWEPPEFVLRQALNYDEFCRLVYKLLRDETAEVIAAAFGVRESDIEIAAQLYSAWLQKESECPR